MGAKFDPVDPLAVQSPAKLVQPLTHLGPVEHVRAGDFEFFDVMGGETKCHLESICGSRLIIHLDNMHKGRLEAFSDAVIAIAMTVMVLEMKAPHGHDLAALHEVAPQFGCFVLSFVYLAIYWNNHHHMLQVAEHVNGAVLWANQHLLFWLSLIPFATAWMGEGNGFHQVPIAVYGFVLLMNGVAYTLLVIALIKANGHDSKLAARIGGDFKGKLSIVIYLAGVILAAVGLPVVSCVLYVAVALMWLVPDRRLEPNAPG